ncbi:MAG: transglycosylase SLT domain-containing protein [Acidobacteria bacterium]|nr:transglycosylase SLT domain-containing protein [Acidobacteriota bacterium]
MLKVAAPLLTIVVLLNIGCSGQTEDQALATLRQMTSGGKLPPENVVLDIENRFAGKRTGALAKLLHARIRYEQNDFAGAAAILNSDVFAKKTKLADHALWLRGKALQQAGDNAGAAKVFEELFHSYPDSIRIHDAKLAWAASAIASGRALEVPPMLVEYTEKNDVEALLATAKAYEAQGPQNEAAQFYRKTYFYGAGSAAGKEAETKLTVLAQPLAAQNGEEQLAKADRLLAQKNYAEAATAYADLGNSIPFPITPQIQLRRITAFANAGRMADAQAAFASLPANAKEREDAFRQMVLGYAKAKQWPQAHSTADAMKAAYPGGQLVAKTFIDAGLAARDAKNSTEEGYFLNTAVSAFPNALEVANAQFEAAWYQHEQNNLAVSSQMFIDHLARYTDKDTSNRGKAGYWAARDSQRSGKFAEACALYDGVAYRYGSNWYGYLALDRLTAMRAAGQCRSTQPPDATIAKAVANLRIVNVAAETAGEHERERAAKSDELSIVGLFDWAIDELNEAKKTSKNSPSINMALARHYRWKGDNTAAFLALKDSYPDYAQMFPEELGREEWSIFYPLVDWADLKRWSIERRLDPYQVAGLIRTESVFDPKAKSPANAYGLMQLLLPTARTVAKKYNSSSMPSSPADLYNPPLNIELGTAFLRDQLDKFGRIEYVAIAYNAGPGRVAPWRASLPPEMDEFVEAIPFKETKAYVQGVIRNSAQYRRLYDENGNFKPNVGSRPLRGEIDSKSRDDLTATFPDLVVDDNSGE